MASVLRLLALGTCGLLVGCRLAPDTAEPDPADTSTPATARIEAPEPPEDRPGAAPSPPPDRLPRAEIDTTVLGGYGVFTDLGVYHGDEAPARDGETWQAVVPADAGAALRPVRLRVEVARDEVLDPDDGPFTGRRVTTPASVVHETGWIDDPATLFVRRDAGPLPAGPVPVAMASDTTYFRASRSYPLALGDATYTLTVAADSNATGAYVRQWRIGLVAPDGTAQPLATVENRDDAHPRLVWAGDLDADGRLDLVLDEAWHYNVSVTTLYLSSEAAPGRLVRRVARHETTGC